MIFDVYHAWEAAVNYVAQSQHCRMKLEVYVDAYNAMPAAVHCYGPARVEKVELGEGLLLKKVIAGGILLAEQRSV